MPTTSSQTGKFYAGIVGFPIRITIVDDDGDYLIPNEIAVVDIEGIELAIERPDGSEFTRDLVLPTAIVSHAIEYNFQEDDLPVGGRYRYLLTLSLTGDRTLPVSGYFTIARTEPPE